MTLRDVLYKIAGKGYLPLPVIDKEIHTGHDSCFTVRLMIDIDDFIEFDIQSPLLIPWYDCTVDSFAPCETNTLEVWLDWQEYLKKYYFQYLDLCDKEVINNEDVHQD